MIYDGPLHLIEERLLHADSSKNNNLIARYYFENKPNHLVATEINENPHEDNVIDLKYGVLTDRRGSVMGLTDEFGNVAETVIPASPSGLVKSFVRKVVDQELEAIATITEIDDIVQPKVKHGEKVYRSRIPFGITGLYSDPFTGLNHAHFRDFDTISNTWYLKDPLGSLDGLNRYANYAGLNNMDPDGRSVFSVEDLILMVQQPEAYFSGLQEGAAVGAVASVDSLLNTVVQTASLGFADQKSYLGDYYGLSNHRYYGQAAMSARIGFEILVGVGTGGLSCASKAGWMGKLGRGLNIFDTASNTVGAARSSLDIYQNGWNWQNAAGLFGSAAGLGGNYANFTSRLCFVAGTQVQMADGGYKAIEEIEVGDEVLARSDETGEMGGKKVVTLFETKPRELVELRYVTNERSLRSGKRAAKVDGEGESDDDESVDMCFPRYWCEP